jgi:Ca2+-binding EF-hand superfamily protein
MNTNLKKAVLKQIGISEKEFKKNASDYMNAQNGISGFISYSETHKFALDNQKYINELLDEMADDQGIEVVEMIKSFGIFRKNAIDKDELKDVYRFLGGNKNSDDYETFSILNVLAWLSVETLAFELDN